MRYDYDKHTIGDIAIFGAERFGDSPALAMFEGDVLSYRDIERLSRRAAALLAGMEIRRGGPRCHPLRE